jgi:hypothetical protein
MSNQFRTGIRLSILLLLFTLLLFSDAKVVGKDVFACSPTSFTFGLNFEGECPGNINKTRPGIDGTDCYFVRNSSLALPPIMVRSIQIIENTLELGSLYVETFLGDFEDGDTLEYTSVTAGDLTDENDVPGGIQLNILGEDSNGVPVTNSIIIDYSNSPNEFPVLIGDEIGWIVIVSYLNFLELFVLSIHPHSLLCRWIWHLRVQNIVLELLQLLSPVHPTRNLQ